MNKFTAINEIENILKELKEYGAFDGKARIKKQIYNCLHIVKIYKNNANKYAFIVNECHKLINHVGTIRPKQTKQTKTKKTGKK